MHTNIQYDVYNSTKDVLKDFRSGHLKAHQYSLVTRTVQIFCYHAQMVTSVYS